MLTVICSGPARTRGRFHDELVTLGATIVREDDQALGNLPDWPEDAAAAAAMFRGDENHVAADEWAAIAERRADVDVDWVEATLEDGLLDELQVVAPRCEWLVRMYGPAQPAGTAVSLDMGVPAVEDIVAEAEQRLLARLREQGVIQ